MPPPRRQQLLLLLLLPWSGGAPTPAAVLGLPAAHDDNGAVPGAAPMLWQARQVSRHAHATRIAPMCPAASSSRAQPRRGLEARVASGAAHATAPRFRPPRASPAAAPRPRRATARSSRASRSAISPPRPRPPRASAPPPRRRSPAQVGAVHAAVRLTAPTAPARRPPAWRHLPAALPARRATRRPLALELGTQRIDDELAVERWRTVEKLAPRWGRTRTRRG